MPLLRLIWVAVNAESLHVMDHEDDYNDGDTLVLIEPSRSGVRIDVNPTTKGV